MTGSFSAQRALVETQKVRSCPEKLNSCLQSLVKHVSEVLGYPSQDHNTDREEVILETEFQGARYLLIRIPKSRVQHISLSPRELEIARMVAAGHPNKIIADVLSISSWTVSTHLRRMFAKLGVGSRAAMVARILASVGSQEQCIAREAPAEETTVGTLKPGRLQS